MRRHNNNRILFHWNNFVMEISPRMIDFLSPHSFSELLNVLDGPSIYIQLRFFFLSACKYFLLVYYFLFHLNLTEQITVFMFLRNCVLYEYIFITFFIPFSFTFRLTSVILIRKVTVNYYFG